MIPGPVPPQPLPAGLAPVLPTELLASPGGFAAMLERAPPKLEGDEVPVPVAVLAPEVLEKAPPRAPLDSPWLPPQLSASSASSLMASAVLPTAQPLPELTRVLPTPAPRPAELADSSAPTGDTAVLELVDAALPEGAPQEVPEPQPVVEVVTEASRSTAEAKAQPPPLPEPLDTTRPPLPDDTHLRFQKLTHDQLTLRVEDADGAMDVEVSREQATLQVRIVAPVEAIPDLMGLGNAIEGALMALGLELGSFSTATRDEEPTETEWDDGETGGDGAGGEVDQTTPGSDPNRLLDMLV